MPARALPLILAVLLALSGAAVSVPMDPGAQGADPGDSLDSVETTTPPSTAEMDTSDSGSQSLRAPRLDYTRFTGSIEETSESETAAEDGPNPWGTRQVTVAVASEGEPAERHLESVDTAITYWNQHHEQYTGHNVTFVLDQETERPDVVVDFVSSIKHCGGNDEQITLACAPRYDEDESAAVPTIVRVRENRPQTAIENSVKHEFGHLLGLQHGEGPMPVMAAQKPLQSQGSMLNASERTNPWHDIVLTVAVVQDGGYRQAALRAHVREALEYYENDPEGWDGPTPRFELVRDVERADIVLRVTRDDACEIGGGYCWKVSGEDLDGDEALEYYTGFEATFGGLDSQYLSWYAGRVLGYGLGVESESQLPRIFLDPQEADRRWFDSELTPGANAGEGRTASDAEDPQTQAE